jgi:hypothetical protein
VPVGKRIGRGVALFALLATCATAHAEYKDSYMRGKRAYEDGDYAKAHDLFQQALSEHAEPSARFNPYGKVYTPYIPQHYLGMIALKQGDCAGVHAQWGSSDNRQIMLQLPEIAAEEKQAGATCADKIAAKPAETAKPAVVETAKPAGPTAQPPRTEPAPPKVEPLPQKPVVTTETAKPAPPVAPPPPPPPKPAEKSPEKPVPPEALVQAFEQFLSGRYAEAAKINAENYTDAHARFHAYLVRAAAKYTQARINGDDALLTGARADADAARALDARTIPDATLFSPAFREFYNGTQPKS